jgi:hypothetical protein
MARILPRIRIVPMVNNKILLYPSYFNWSRFEIVLEGPIMFEKSIGPTKGSTPPTVTSQSLNPKILLSSAGAISSESPFRVVTCIANSEPHTRARPSVRLCVEANV